MSDATKRYGATSAVPLSRTDKTAQVGELMTEVGRKLATMVTTQFTQDPDDYIVTVTVTMEANQL